MNSIECICPNNALFDVACNVYIHQIFPAITGIVWGSSKREKKGNEKRIQNISQPVSKNGTIPNIYFGTD